MGKWLERARRLSYPQGCDNSANSIGHAVSSGPIVTIGAIVTGSGVRGWGAQDWQAEFGERAGMFQYEGGKTRTVAETDALDHCAVKWMALNPPVDRGERACCHCGEYAGSDALVILAGDGNLHRVIHSWCHAPMLHARKVAAITAIEALIGDVIAGSKSDPIAQDEDDK